MKFSHLIHFRLFQMDRQSSDNRVHHLHRHLAPISVGALMLLSFVGHGRGSRRRRPQNNIGDGDN
jgi:hypothetical protein